MSRPHYFVGLLVLLGAGWGITQPLSKIAVSEGYRHFGLVFWQFCIGACVLSLVLFLQGRRLPIGAAQIKVYAFFAVIGTLIPNSASYESARHLPSGILSILLSMVPMFAFPIALAFGLERFQARRLFGLLCGFAGILLIVGPEASLPDPSLAIWIPLALVASLFYAFEGNLLAKFGSAGTDPIQLLCGVSWVGIALTLPFALISGQWISPLPPWGAPDGAMLASGVIHATVYASYFWMVTNAGAVFAAQVGYLVTGFGVIWAMLILGESYPPTVWAALGLMFLGVFLVQPRETPTPEVKAA